MSDKLFSKQEIIEKLDEIQNKLMKHHESLVFNLLDVSDMEETCKEHAIVFNLAVQIGCLEELKNNVEEW